MGHDRDAAIREFQRQAGIKPATGRCAELLSEMKRAAVQLLEILALERAGIRDGDGFWGGSDPLEICDDFPRLYREYEHAARKARREEVATFAMWSIGSALGDGDPAVDIEREKVLSNDSAYATWS